MPRSRILYYWAPAAICAALILAASSEPFAASHTGEWIQAVIARLTGSPMPPDPFAIAHFIIRKLAHLTEYAIFGALVFRAWRADRAGWSWRWAIAAIITAAALASIDEWHQTFVPGRTGAVADVFLDLGGATLSQIAIARTRGRLTLPPEA